MKIIKPPNSIESSSGFSVFLAGSIEMGIAENWQDKVQKALSDIKGVIFNPRRDDWNPLWAQTKINPYFWEQVTWELNALEAANLICLLYTSPSPRD